MAKQGKELRTKENTFYLFSWLIYAVITFFALLNHEPNRDEAQVWLIVRDLDICSIYYELSAMGHPGLWYFILLPFAKAGFPYITMLILHWIIGIAAAAILLSRGNITPSLKIIFLFSYYMLFEYMVPARNYSLTILLLFIIGATYESRFSNPVRYALLIVALYNTNTHSFGAASGLLLIYIIEAYKEKKLLLVKNAIFIMIAGMCSFIFQLWPSLFEVSRNVTIKSTLIPAFNFNDFWVIVTGIQNAFLPVSSQYEEIKVALFFTLFFIIFLITLTQKKSIFLFMIISSGWLFYLFTTKLSGSWRHEGLLLIFILFSIWISTYYKKSEVYLFSNYFPRIKLTNLELSFNFFLTVCLAVNIIFGFKSILKEYRFSYSGAEEAARFIQDNHFDNAEIACYRSWRATALAPYLPKNKFWLIDRNEFGTYYKLDSTYYKYGDALTEEEVITKIKNKYPQKSILIFNEKLLRATNQAFHSKLLFENKRVIWGSDDERYYIYSIEFNTDSLTH